MTVQKGSWKKKCLKLSKLKVQCFVITCQLLDICMGYEFLCFCNGILQSPSCDLLLPHGIMWCHIAEEWRLICMLCYRIMSEMPSKFLVCIACDWAGDSCKIYVLTVVLPRIQVSGGLTLCQTLLDRLTHEAEGITVFRNAGRCSTHNTLLHPRRSEALRYIYSIVEGIPILWFIIMKQNLFLTCLYM